MLSMFVPCSEQLADLAMHGKLIARPSAWLVPKRWFSHFYIYAFFASLLYRGVNSSGSILLLLHLNRRWLEQTVCFPGDSESKMHAIAYIFSFVFYSAVILTVPDSAQSVFLWVIGNVGQFLSHRDLFMNRMGSGCKRNPPNTWLFRFLNCPHYAFEMLIYISLSGGDWASFWMTSFVIVSLSVNWRNHSRWYSTR